MILKWGMGEVRVEIVVVNPRTGARSEEIIALADTGATLTVIPAEILQGLGIPAPDIHVRHLAVERLARRRSYRSIADVGVVMRAILNGSATAAV